MSENKTITIGGEVAVIVDLTKRATLYATEKNPYKKEGEIMNVGEIAGEHLIKKGFATKTKSKKQEAK